MTDFEALARDLAIGKARSEPTLAQFVIRGLVAVLKHFSPLIAVPLAVVMEDDTEEKKMLEAARYLKKWLPLYTWLDEDENYGWINRDAEIAVETIQVHLPELIEFLEYDIRPQRKGGRPRDPRRQLCADVCAELWRQLHGGVEPHSIYLQRACSAYWRASSHEPIGQEDDPRNWLRHLEEAKATYDPVFRSQIAQLRSSGSPPRE